MMFRGCLAIFPLVQLVVAQTYTVPPPTNAPSDTVQDCTGWYVGNTGDSCDRIASDNSITVSQLYSYNPSLANGCKVVSGTSYCVEENWGVPPPVSTTSTSTSSTTTSTGIFTPSPTQPPSIVAGCTKFYFVKSGSTCSDVLTTNGITVAQLYSWNVGVKPDCTGLQAEVYVCVAGPQSNSTTTTTTTTGPPPTSTGTNGIATPSPTQPPSIVSNCNKFYFVEPNTNCATVLSKNGITVAQLYAWNSGVNADCSGMWASVWLCVGVVGGGSTTATTTSSTKPPPTSTGSNGIATPSPTQPPSIVSNCNKFYFVEPNTSCATVLSKNGITVAQLYAWNSGVNADCSGMWASVWLCVGVIGGSSTTTTSTKPPPTSTGSNGLPTPSPTQPPSIVSNCNKFFFVEPNMTCSTVLSKNGITIAQLYKWNPGVNSDCTGLWSSVWVCVSVTK